MDGCVLFGEQEGRICLEFEANEETRLRDCLADVHESVRPGPLAFPARRLTRPHEARQVFVSLWQTQRRAHALPPILGVIQ